MPIEVRKVSYSWDSVMENAGLDGYRLDCFVWRDGQPVVDRHESFRTKQELLEAMEDVVPLLSEVPEPASASTTPAQVKQGCAAAATAAAASVCHG